MKTVTVCASKTYDIHIGADLLPKLGFYARTVSSGNHVCIVSDSKVWPLYGQTATAALESSGFTVHSFVFPQGEASKNGATLLDLLNDLALAGLTRSDLIIALGGGVVGDLTGFAAAVYLRGISYIQVPTTVLASVDSSVGGKTAIDLPAGKNLAGAFYQPSLVICDTNTMATLPEEIFRDGCAEVIKYAVLYDPGLFAKLEQMILGFSLEDVISRCVIHKARVVIQDEFDTGERMKLNLGHTIGHAIEAASHFTVSHGQAVAIGMAIVARSCGCPDASRIEALLKAFGLPVTTDIPAQTLLGYTLSDKKRSRNSVRMILPNAIGSCRMEDIPVSQLQSFIEAGL